MVQTTVQQLSKAEFWSLAESAEDVTYELIDGVAIPKMSPKYFHSHSASNILILLRAWAKLRGRVEMEWAFELNENSTPVPDLLYVSFDRLPATWKENAACPVAPELAIEIISPGQTFGQMNQKASQYLAGGVLRVWVVEPAAQSVTVLYPDAAPITYQASQIISDPLFPELEIVTQDFFDC
jgi:Uma2 family endonuclease